MLAALVLAAFAPAPAGAAPLAGLRVDFTTGANPDAVALADLDGTGWLDMAVANEAASSVSVLFDQGPGAFFPKHDIPVGAGPRAIAIADLNGDGVPDFVTANGSANTISVVLGRRGGTFVPAADYPVGTGPRAIAIADLNGDGFPDVVTADYFAGTVSVLLNDGFGRFTARTDLPCGTAPSAVAIADVDGDGYPDVVVASAATNSVSLMNGDGTGALGARVRFGTGASPTAIAIADLDGDGHPECVTANYADSSVTILRGVPGGFGERTDVATGAGPTSLVVADVNGDGFPDVVVANARDNTVSVLPGDGGGTVAPGPAYVTGLLPYGLAVGDLDGDGLPDLVTADASGHAVSVDFGTHANAFGVRPALFAGTSPSGLVAADLDGDGLPDLAVTNYGSNTVSIFKGDGLGGFGARTDLVTGRGPLGIAAGDLDGDGAADLVVTSAGDSTMSIFFADGRGGFRPRVDYRTQLVPCAVAIGNVLGDSLPDLVVANQGSNSVSMFMNTGGGVFGSRSDWTTGSSPRSVAVGDLNADGHADVLTADFNSRSVSVLLSTYGVGFTPGVSWPIAGLNPSAIAVADVNGDHYPDVVVANSGSGTVTVLLGNGAGGYVSSTEFAAGAGAHAIAVADVNSDGHADLVVGDGAGGAVSVLLGDGTGTFASSAEFATGASPSGVAAFVPSGGLVGRRMIAAANPGDGTITLLVPRAQTATALAADPEASLQGGTVTLRATVTRADAGLPAPTGAVRFSVRGADAGEAPLVDGVATLAVSVPWAGLGTFGARYAGDEVCLSSLAAPLSHHAYRCSPSWIAGLPDTAFEGDEVVFTGRGFPSVSAVRFGGVPSLAWTLVPTAFAPDSARVTITATVPVGALSGEVRVEGPCGVVASSAPLEVRRHFTFTTVHTDRFGYLTGVGWPVSASLGDTSGVPLPALQLRGRENYDWRVRRWDAGAQAYVAVDRLRAGTGYWIQTHDPWSATLVGAVTPESTLVEPLTARGWHLLGNPFSAPVPVTSLRVVKRGIARTLHGQTDVQSTVFAWDAGAGALVAATSIPAGGVFWVRRLSLASAESLLVPPPADAVPAGADDSVPALDWSARVSARQAGSVSSVTVGVAPLAAGAAHPLDAECPPDAAAGALSLSLSAPDETGAVAPWQCLVRDRAAAAAWDLVLDGATAPGEVTLTLDAGSPPAGTRFVLRESARGFSAALDPGAGVTLAALGGPRRLRLEAEPADAAAHAGTAEAIRAYPSPFAGVTGFWFAHRASSDLRVEVYDLSGRLVRKLERRDAPAGENVLVWDGRDARGGALPAAVYFARCDLGDRREVLRVVRLP